MFIFIFFPDRCDRCFSNQQYITNEHYLENHGLCEFTVKCSKCDNGLSELSYSTYAFPRGYPPLDDSVNERIKFCQDDLSFNIWF
jgi:hypothetical protein